MEYIVSKKEMQQADRSTQEVYGIGWEVLMERAALCVTETLKNEYAAAGGKGLPRVLVFAGGGGNGGDGIAAARILHTMGAAVLLVTVGDVSSYGEKAVKQLDIAMKYDVPFIRMQEPADAEAVRMVTGARFDYIVDALFGVGLSRPLSGVYSAAVALMMQLRENGAHAPRILSIDLPSGLDTDTGEILGMAVRADLTLTMGFRKRGITLYPGASCAGEIRVADVGITEESFLGELPVLAAFDEDPRQLLPARDPAGHKGSFGKLLIAAGNGHTGGAAILCARAAFAAGAGMVRVFTEKKNRTAILSAVPEAIVDCWDEEMPEDRIGELLREGLKWATACVAGPGLGTDRHAVRILTEILSDGRLPLVLDADACNMIALDPQLKELAVGYRGEACWPVLTPHIAEFARLAGIGASEAARHTEEKTQDLAQELFCTVLCKGARSYTAQAGMRTVILNLTGNAGMGTAGSGDVLAGIIGAFAAAGMEAMDAAAAGSYIHGLAGDGVAAKKGQYAMTASDLIDGLGEILR